MNEKFLFFRLVQKVQTGDVDQIKFIVDAIYLYERLIL